MNRSKVAILQHIIAPTKTLAFNALSLITQQELQVLYLAESSCAREWKSEKSNMNFSFDIIFNNNFDNIHPLKLSMAIWKWLNSVNPATVIIGGYNYLAWWSALMWAKKNKKAVIVLIESQALDRPRSKVKENIKRLFVSLCNAALVDGTRHRNYAASLGMKSESIFIKRGAGPIDVSFYMKECSRHKKNKLQLCDSLKIPRSNFLFVGRFSNEKNIKLLLRAYKKLKERGAEDWGLILVGNGPQKEEIQNFININSIKDTLIPGFKQMTEIPMFYAISNILILPSTSEPWGLVAGEAMACGLPVLVSDRCGCYPDIVHDNINGFSFDPLNENDLLKLMKEITKGKYNLDAMGKASVDIIKDYTPQKAAEAYSTAINFVITGSQS